MEINKRSNNIISFLVANPYATCKEVQENLKLTYKQFSYAFSNANDFLKAEYGETIEKNRQGTFVISDSLMAKLKEFDNKCIFTSKERAYLVILISLLSRGQEESITLQFISSVLDVSKNTTLASIKSANDLIEKKYHSRIIFDHLEGYTMFGDERSIRDMILAIVPEIVKIFENDPALQNKLFSSEMSQKTISFIDGASEKIGCNFTGKRKKNLFLIVCIYFERMASGHLVDSLPETYYSIQGTREFEIIKSFLNEQKINFNYNECLLLTMQLLISNIDNVSDLEFYNRPIIYNQVFDIVDNFETLSCVKFADKDKLYEYMYMHWAPAYFRIKYNFHFENDMEDYIKNEYANLNELVRNSVTPVLQKADMTISEAELSFITVLLGGWMKRESESKTSQKGIKALVVCENGIVSSQYMLETLKTLFNGISFVGCMSIPQFNSFTGDYDVVFTTQKLNTEKKQYIVNLPLSEVEKTSLVNSLINDNFDDSGSLKKIEDTLNAVKKYSPEIDIDGLRKEIQKIFAVNDVINIETKKTETSLTLKEVMPKEHILHLNRVNSWEDSIFEMANSLIVNNVINSNYPLEIIKSIKENKPFIEITPGVVVYHAGVDAGVNNVGFAFLKTDEEVNINNYIKARMFLMVATDDPRRHVQALEEFIELMSDERKEQILNCQNADQLYSILFEQ